MKKIKSTDYNTVFTPFTEKLLAVRGSEGGYKLSSFNHRLNMRLNERWKYCDKHHFC